ncbi:MAG: hypothetical protein ACRDGV_08800 [Candidatus Limnocylindria bacterium]
MRQRFGSLRARSMARRTGDDGRLQLSPRTRVIAGWVAVVAVLGVVAVVVGLLGGDADGPVIDPRTSPSAGVGDEALPIAFGTALDAASGAVATDAVTDRFAAGDTFAYSFTPDPPSDAAQIYVEVERVGDGPSETVQAPVEAQGVAPGAEVIAFQVPADALLAAFGTGEFAMRIYFEPDGELVAEGEFLLIGPAPTAS